MNLRNEESPSILENFLQDSISSFELRIEDLDDFTEKKSMLLDTLYNLLYTL